MTSSSARCPMASLHSVCVILVLVVSIWAKSTRFKPPAPGWNTGGPTGGGVVRETLVVPSVVAGGNMLALLVAALKVVIFEMKAMKNRVLCHANCISMMCTFWLIIPYRLDLLKRSLGSKNGYPCDQEQPRIKLDNTKMSHSGIWESQCWMNALIHGFRERFYQHSTRCPRWTVRCRVVTDESIWTPHKKQFDQAKPSIHDLGDTFDTLPMYTITITPYNDTWLTLTVIIASSPHKCVFDHMVKFTQYWE